MELKVIISKIKFRNSYRSFLYARISNLESFEFDQPYLQYKQLFQSKRKLKKKKKKKKKVCTLNTLFTVQGCSSHTRIAEGHDYVTSRSDEGFTLPDPILTRSWSQLHNQT